MAKLFSIKPGITLKGRDFKTVITRLGRSEKRSTQVWRTINRHAAVMSAATVVVAADLATRLKNIDARQADLSTTVMSVVAALLVSFGSVYGGELVYDFQFNVESLEGSKVWDETEADQLPADRPQSEW